MTPTIANGQPAALAYRRAGDGPHEPFAVVVLDTDGRSLTSITVFPGPDLVTRFSRL
jgi:RNA polymerase sigma-70 factor (ECF subfamily)